MEANEAKKPKRPRIGQPMGLNDSNPHSTEHNYENQSFTPGENRTPTADGERQGYQQHDRPTARKATSRARADISHVKAVTSSAQEDSVQGGITMGATSNARADITRTASKGAISSAMPSSGQNRLKPSARPAQQQQPPMRQLLTQQPHRPPNIPAVINHARATSPVRVISHAITTRGATSSAREATTRTANREATSSAPVATTTSRETASRKHLSAKGKVSLRAPSA